MIVEIRIIVNKHIVDDHFLNNRMSSAFDVDQTVFIDLRATVIVLACHYRQRNKHVDFGNRLRSLLDTCHIRRNLITDLTEQIVLEIHQTILCAEDRILKFLEFRRDVTLRICQRLLSHIIIGNHILKGIRHFQIVTEYFIVLDSKVLDSCLFFFRCFQICQPFLTVR